VAAAIAFAISSSVAVVGAVIVRALGGVGDFNFAGADLFGSDAPFAVSAYAMEFALHQVPLTVGSRGLLSNAPLLLSLVPLAACIVGLNLARRLWSDEVERAAPLFAFAFCASYGTALAIVSLFGVYHGAVDPWSDLIWDGATPHSVVYGSGIAYLALHLYRRRRGHQLSSKAAGILQRLPARIARRSSGILLAGILLASVLWVFPSTVRVFQDQDGAGDRAVNVVATLLYAPDAGVNAFAHGLFARNYEDDDDDLLQEFVWDAFGVTEGERLLNIVLRQRSSFDWSLVSFLFVLAAFVPVVLTGLFSGFSIARDHPERTREIRWLCAAAGTGLVWFIAVPALLFVGQGRFVDEFEWYWRVDVRAIEAAAMALVLGGILGGIGGVLSTSQSSSRTEVEAGRQ